jgi:hypothetical protein
LSSGLRSPPWSRRVVSWAMTSDLRAEVVLDGLGMAVGEPETERILQEAGIDGVVDRALQEIEVPPGAEPPHGRPTGALGHSRRHSRPRGRSAGGAATLQGHASGSA